jgi:TPR repeat protein
MSSKPEPKCGVEGCREIETLHCKGCLIKFYCGKECQTRDWSQHKGGCKEIAAMNKKKAEDELSNKLAHDIQTLCAAGCGEEALERCSVCAGAKYCGRKCQKKHWPEHKVLCKVAAEVLSQAGFDVEELDRDIKQYKIRAEEKDLDAQYHLGIHLFQGVGVSVDKCEAFRWFKRAAESGHIKSMRMYGICYCNGEGVAKDVHEGIKWITRSGEAGWADAQYSLGKIYENGRGIAVDIHAAIKWFTLASKAGHLGAKDALTRLSNLD